MTLSARPICVPREKVMRGRARDGANVDRELHVAFEAIDAWSYWSADISIGAVQSWTTPDVMLRPTAIISMDERDLRWMIQRLGGLLDHITTHDCGEIADLKHDQESRQCILPIGGAR